MSVLAMCSPPKDISLEVDAPLLARRGLKLGNAILVEGNRKAPFEEIEAREGAQYIAGVEQNPMHVVHWLLQRSRYDPISHAVDGLAPAERRKRSSRETDGQMKMAGGARRCVSTSRYDPDSHAMDDDAQTEHHGWSSRLSTSHYDPISQAVDDHASGECQKRSFQETYGQIRLAGGALWDLSRSRYGPVVVLDRALVELQQQGSRETDGVMHLPGGVVRHLSMSRYDPISQAVDDCAAAECHEGSSRKTDGQTHAGGVPRHLSASRYSDRPPAESHEGNSRLSTSRYDPISQAVDDRTPSGRGEASSRETDGQMKMVCGACPRLSMSRYDPASQAVDDHAPAERGAWSSRETDGQMRMPGGALRRVSRSRYDSVGQSL